jgi:hypothetical protein
MDAMPVPDKGRSRTWLLVTFVFLLAWQIALVWMYPHFVTQDGHSHLYNAALLRHFHDPGWPRLTEFYQRNSRLVPNWFTYAVLAGLYGFVSPAAAEKIVVTAYFILFPLSFAYVLRTLSRHSWLYMIWGLVFADNLFIAMGFYNFCYSMVFFLLCFGYWMKWRDRFGPKHLLILCVLASLLYFSHVVGFLMAEFFIGVIALCFGVSDDCSSKKSPSKKNGKAPSSLVSTLAKRVLLPQLAFLPCLAVFLSSSSGSQPAYDPGPRTFAQRLLIFRDLHVLVDSRGPDAILRMFLIGGFLIFASYLAIARAPKNDRFPASHGLGIVALVCLSLCIVLPWSISGGGMLPERMAWFGLCAAFLWLGSVSNNWSTRTRQTAVAISALVVVLGLIGQTEWRHEMAGMLNAYDEAGRMLEPQKTILSLCYCNPADNPSRVFSNLRIRPLEHAGDIAALEGRSLSLDNYEAMGSAFPIEYTPDVNPALHEKTFAASSVASKPRTADIVDYETRTGKTVDYVLLWGANRDKAETKSVLGQQLQSNYETIYTSSPPAQLRLFKRK